MIRFSTAVFAAVALVVAIGCGGGNNVGVSRGDRLTVTENLERIRFEADYHLPDNPAVIGEQDGALIELPAGTIVEVLVNPRAVAGIVEVRPVSLPIRFRPELEDGTLGDYVEQTLTDPEEIRNYLLPERYIRWNFMGYSMSLSLDLIGNQLKKVEGEN